MLNRLTYEVTEIALDLQGSIWSFSVKLAVIADSSAYLEEDAAERFYLSWIFLLTLMGGVC